MKKIKRVLSLLVVAGMVMASLTACGKKAGDKSSTFYIGGSGPLTGSYAAYGMGVANGAELAVKEINAAGGINGTKIDFKYEDDEGDGEKAINAYNTLKDAGMNIFMGTVTSGACASVINKTNEDSMFSSDSLCVLDGCFGVGKCISGMLF